MPPPPPLRTARAPFDACSSSIGQRTCYSTRLPALALGTTCTVLRRSPQPGHGANARATAGSRTSRGLAPRRHLLCFLKGFAGRSRAPTPEGSQLPFGWGPAAVGLTPIRLATGRRSLPPSSSARSPVGRPCGLPPSARGATGLPRSVAVAAWVRSCLSAGGATPAYSEFGAP